MFLFPPSCMGQHTPICIFWCLVLFKYSSNVFWSSQQIVNMKTVFFKLQSQKSSLACVMVVHPIYVSSFTQIMLCQRLLGQNLGLYSPHGCFSLYVWCLTGHSVQILGQILGREVMNGGSVVPLSRVFVCLSVGCRRWCVYAALLACAAVYV